ncbi:MAG: 2Fe-2S iron-sulfur cluster binding domain-containing protein [SAR324 cluster bacterium]|nr:2Fe-2S iron-sulfur cluster binding domain-containing protein [SAR324 cluster bacterium]
MSGINPYIETSEATLPQNNYKIRFLPEDVTIEVDAGQLNKASEGRLGSILDLAEKNELEIDHSCGGVCACSTCHVIIREGLDSCNEASEDEEDMLELAPGLCPESRLACQCIPDGSQDIVVEIPGWNRNLVKEVH